MSVIFSQPQWTPSHRPPYPFHRPLCPSYYFQTLAAPLSLSVHVFIEISKTSAVFVCTDWRMVKEIEENMDLVLGMTSVDDELFVLFYRDDDQVAVYNINDYKLLRHLSLPGLEGDQSNNMMSCVRRKRLYVSNRDSNCIHRFDLSSSAITKWSVPNSPELLSVTLSSNLLVACGEKLVELSADSGQCVREIKLQSDIKCLCHAVQLTTGQFVVCHGYWDDGDFHQYVCLVDDEGKVTRSYVGQPGSFEQLRGPCYLAVDEDSQFVFVADFGSGLLGRRVVLLSPTLEFVCDYSDEEVSGPHRLYLHQATRRLYVANGQTIVVIQL